MMQQRDRARLAEINALTRLKALQDAQNAAERELDGLRESSDAKEYLDQAIPGSVRDFRDRLYFGPVSYTHLTLPTILLV